MLRRLHSIAPLALLAGVAIAYGACGGDGGGTGGTGGTGPSAYDLKCPSAAGSCANADGALMVGFGQRDITPTVTETFRDCGFDNLCPGDPGYTAPDSGENDGEFQGHPGSFTVEPFDDVNGNGFFDAVWIAGYGNARPAQGVHDPIEVRAIVLRKGETTLALVAVDLVGYFFDQVERIRADLDPALGVDHLLVSATHNHEGPDSVGIWGYDEGSSGVDPAYMTLVRERIELAVSDAVAGLTEAKVFSAVGIPNEHPVASITTSRGINNVVEDYRDPVVLDKELRMLHFKKKSDDSVLGTLVNWTNHPEALCSDNSYISSDFTHYLRDAIENGVDRSGVQETGVGGISVFINGPVGGLLSPGRIRVADLDGTEFDTCKHTESETDPFFGRARAVGQLVALNALRILANDSEELVDPDLSFAAKKFDVPVQNKGYHAMFITGVFFGACEYDNFGTTVPRRCITGFDENERITEDNLPWLTTEVSVINLGAVQMVTSPGEPAPEYWLGGYDGSQTGPNQDVINNWYNREPSNSVTCTNDASCSPLGDAECDGAALYGGRSCSTSNCCCTGGVCRSDNFNPPDLSAAPAGPYLKDRMTRRIKWLLGLTPDELGYILPEYDYKLDDRIPYLEEPPGDHYEETNSVGPKIGQLWDDHLTALLQELP